MSELKLKSHNMQAARLGSENPLPHFDILPYKLQDGYGREREERSFKTVVLENNILKATFLLELGGRPWSLYNKKEKYELLYVNPVFQPSNLAIRNAWFSGGVEWNMGIKGHSVFTCSPVFAAQLKMDDGTPVLRIYEWDRIRMAPYQIDFFLPDNSDFLFARMKIINPHNEKIPMYWWSNISFPEIPGGRVIVPAESAIRHSYDGTITSTPFPFSKGIDLSYPNNYNSSFDCYYNILPEQQPWIAALDREGCGLIQTSTSKLKGRKLFVWGMQQGGRQWQDFLSVPGSAYIELQAGLAQTQSEYLDMPANSEWSWLEAYGLIQTDTKITYGEDWKSAWRYVDSKLKEKISPDKLETIFLETLKMAERKPDEIIQRGSGWGALERRRRNKNKEKPFCSESMVFDDKSLTEEERPWIELLEKGSISYSSPTEEPTSYMTQYQWQEMLEKAVNQPANDHWLSWLHLGIMYYTSNDFEKAEEAWEISIRRSPSPWAYYNLAFLAKKNKDMDRLISFLHKAWSISPQTFGLTVEYCKALINSGNYRTALDFIEKLPSDVRNMGRIKIAEVQAFIRIYDIDRAEKILRSGFSVSDIKEGEVVLSNLWFEMKEIQISEKGKIPIDDNLKKRVKKEFPPPVWLDFRQTVK